MRKEEDALSKRRTNRGECSLIGHIPSEIGVWNLDTMETPMFSWACKNSESVKMNIRNTVTKSITGMVDLPGHGDDATDYLLVLAKVSLGGQCGNK